MGRKTSDFLELLKQVIEVIARRSKLLKGFEQVIRVSIRGFHNHVK